MVFVTYNFVLVTSNPHEDVFYYWRSSTQCSKSPSNLNLYICLIGRLRVLNYPEVSGYPVMSGI